MKKVFVPLLLAFMCCLFNIATAQTTQSKNHKKTPSPKKEETIVLNENGKEKVVIEIKEGSLYINGEEQSRILDVKNEDHKIVININPGNEEKENNEPPKHIVIENHRKAMLGVYTNPAGNGSGAVITSVIPNSGAYDAGLMRGDIIKQIDGKDVKNATDLSAIINNNHPGDKVNVTYSRYGNTQNVQSILTASDFDNDWTDTRFNNTDWGINFGNGRGIMFFNNKTPKIGITAQNTQNEDGAEILDVKPGSPAEKAGLQKGDIITKLDYDRVNTIDDIPYIINSADLDRKIKVLYKRNGEINTTYLDMMPDAGKKDF